jgi:hypothetical protein
MLAPASREGQPKWAMPEVPSIDQPPSPSRAFALLWQQVGHNPQLFTNLWKAHSASFNLHHDGNLNKPPSAKARPPLRPRRT